MTENLQFQSLVSQFQLCFEQQFIIIFFRCCISVLLNASGHANSATATTLTAVFNYVAKLQFIQQIFWLLVKKRTTDTC